MAQRIEAHPDAFTFPSGEVQECPFPFYEALREQAPIYQIPGRHEFLVSRWEDVTYIAERPAMFSSILRDATVNPAMPADGEGDGYDFGYSPTSMALCDPPENKMKRAVGAKLVGREPLRDYEPLILQYTDELIDSFIDAGACEFVDAFAYWLPIKVIIHVLGLPQEDMVLLKRLGDLAGQGSRFMTPEELETEGALRTELHDYLRKAILERVESPREDGLSWLVTGQMERDGRLNLPYLLSESGVLLFAGNTTTTHMLASAMLLMLQNPDEHRRILEDRTLIKPLLEETLRLESPVQWTQRYAVEDTEVGGVPVKAGSTLLCLWASGNRDAKRWGDDAAEFHVDRPQIAKHHLAFGRGTHLCLGAPLARLEGEIAFRRLLDRLGNLRLRDNDIEHIDVHHMRAPRAVHIEFDSITA